MKNSNVLQKLEKFIDHNYNSFANLGNSETEPFDESELDNDVINYLKEHYRFDYRGICVYYVKRNNEVWVENMNS